MHPDSRHQHDAGDDYVIEGAAPLVSDPERLGTIATAFEQAYGWDLTREDGTWSGMADQMRARDQHLLRQTEHHLPFGNGEPFGQTRYHFD